MLRFDENHTTDAELDAFVATLKRTQFTHKDVMRCYSIYMRNEYIKNKDNPGPPPLDSFGRQRAGGKRIPVRWSEQEVEALKNGVATLGKGNWAKIIEMYPNIFGPTARTGRDLKKKWLGLENKNDTIPKTINHALNAQNQPINVQNSQSNANNQSVDQNNQVDSVIDIVMVNANDEQPTSDNNE